MVFTHKPKITCQEIEARIEEDAKNIDLMLKKHFPFSENLPGIKDHASVFELCKGPVAIKLLNTQPELNVLMPCRIALFKKEGECYVSTPDLSVQLGLVDCEESLKKDILSLYADIISMMKKW